MNNCNEANNLRELQEARESGVVWGYSTCARAAALGDIPMLRWAIKHGCPHNSWVCYRAAANGRLATLQWLWSNGLCGKDDANVALGAARGGHLKILLWASERGCAYRTEDVAVAAAERGHARVLAWLHTRGGAAQWGPRVCAAAAEFGDVSVLRWMKRVGCCPMDATTHVHAAAGGHIKVMEWLAAQEGGVRPSQPAAAAAATAAATAAAAANGHLDALVWMMDCGGGHYYPVDEQRILRAAAKRGHIDILCELGKLDAFALHMTHASVIESAIAGGQIDVVKWLIDPTTTRLRGPSTLPPDTCEIATAHKRANVLKWARLVMHCPWGHSMYTAATKHYSAETLVWMMDQGCVWDRMWTGPRGLPIVRSVDVAVVLSGAGVAYDIRALSDDQLRELVHVRGIFPRGYCAQCFACNDGLCVEHVAGMLACLDSDTPMCRDVARLIVGMCM